MTLIDQAAGPDTSVPRSAWPTPELGGGSSSDLDLMPPWKRILVPVDFSLESMKTLSYASKLARSLSASLDIVHVLTARPPGARVGAVPRLAGLDREDLAEAARAKLLSVIKRKVHWQVPWNVWIRDGQPHREILEAAARYDVKGSVPEFRNQRPRRCRRPAVCSRLMAPADEGRRWSRRLREVPDSRGDPIVLLNSGTDPYTVF